MAVLPILAVILVTMLVKARPFVRVPMPGKVLKTLPMNLWQKMMVQRVSLYALGIVLVLGAVAGWLTGPLQWITLLVVFAVLLFPMSYTFTTQGVAVGQAFFRTWDEFTGYARRGSRITLQHSSPLASLPLFLKPGECDAVQACVSKYVHPKVISQGKGEIAK